MRKLYLFSMFLLLAYGHAIAQNRVLKGTVQNAQGDPLSGATIYVVGGNTSTTSDTTGSFSVSISPTAKQLVITYVGFVSQTIPLRNQTSIDIRLESNDPNLNEVVVVAYGTQKKKL